MTASKAPPEDWKKRKMVRGQWTTPEPKGTKQRADRTIPVRISEAELAEFDDQIGVLGLNRNAALRICARRVGGFVELDLESKAELKALKAQLTGIARNINQIARAANRTADPEYHRFMKQRQALGPVLFSVEARIDRLLHQGNRRTDGRERLEREAGSAK